MTGFVTASAHPSPQVQELAATTSVKILSLTPQQLATVQLIDKTAIGIVIPKGTYPTQDYDVTTLSVPVGAYATTRMDDATAYAVTRAFWTQRVTMAKQNPLWGGVSADMLGSLAGKLHPGAIRYYEEAKVAVPQSAR